MDAETNCKECEKPFKIGDHSISCEGFCSNVYHIECAKYSFDELMCYRKLRNVWYICEECRTVMKQVRSSRSTSDTKKEIVDPPKPPHTCMKFDQVDQEIAALKDQIALIHQSLADVSSAHSTQISDAVNTNVPLAQSTVISSSALLCGTKHIGNLMSTPIGLSVATEKYWLFFTRIKNSVTGDCLGTDDATVRKLVPAWRDTSSMPYISFKIGIPVLLKATPQRPPTWPAGLCFREFRENVWEPS